MGRHLVGNRRRVAGNTDYIATAYINLVCQTNDNRVPAVRLTYFLITTNDRRDFRAHARRGYYNIVAYLNLTGGNISGEATKILIRAAHPLHRQTKTLRALQRLNLDGFQMLQQCWACVPGHCVTIKNHVIAFQSRQGNRSNRSNIQSLRQHLILLENIFKNGLVVIDQIHFIHCQHNVFDAQQTDDITVSACLCQQAFAGIDKHYSDIGRRSASRHITGVLFMPGAIGNDKFAPLSIEITIRHINGDALLTLGFKTIEQ